MLSLLRPKTQTERLFEDVSFSGAGSVDEENGVIRGVKIIGHESKNGRTYTANALQGAVSLYEGVKVYVDHLPEDSRRSPRSRKFAERVGHIERVHYEADGLRGDFHYMKSHQVAPMIVEAAQRKLRDVGFSHVAEGTTRRSGGKTIVEEIKRVVSVDLVSDPATTRSLFESQQEADMPRKMKDVVEALPADSFGRDKLSKLIEGNAELAELDVDISEKRDADVQVRSCLLTLVEASLAGSDDAKDAVSEATKLLESFGQKPAEDKSAKPEDKGGEQPTGLSADVKALTESVSQLVEAQKALAEQNKELATKLSQAEHAGKVQPKSPRVLREGAGRNGRMGGEAISKALKAPGIAS